MSLISIYEIDRSAELARRFAHLAAGYADDAEAAKQRTSQIPMENLFRILEMYRYNAFSDESRGGVLAIESFGTPRPILQTSNWHEPILGALEVAMGKIFNFTQTDNRFGAAIDELQDGLRKIGKGEITDPSVRTVKSFLQSFESELA